MIARALLVVPVLAAAAGPLATSAPASSSLEDGCTFTAAPTTAEIGQPIALELVVAHPSGTRAIVDDEWTPPEGEWIVYGGRPAITRDAGDGTAVTTIAWTVAAIDAGELALDAPAVAYEVDGVTRDCVGTSVTLTIASALTESDEGPRPAAAPPAELTPEERDAAARYVSPWWFAFFPFAGLVALGVVVMARRAPRDVAAPRGPSADEVLAALDVPPGGDDVEGTAAFCATVRAALRGAWDRARGADLAGRTDAEWLDAHGFDGERRERLATVLSRCEAARFGGDRPTRFALREWRDAARASLPREGDEDAAHDARRTAEVAP